VASLESSRETPAPTVITRRVLNGQTAARPSQADTKKRQPDSGNTQEIEECVCVPRGQQALLGRAAVETKECGGLLRKVKNSTVALWLTGQKKNH